MKPALALALLLFTSSLSSAQAQDTRGDLGPALLERLAPLRAEHELPALAGLVIKGGRTVGIAAVGSRRLGSPEAVTVDDPWHLGSCTKAMTATLLGALVQDGALTFETTLGDVYADLAPGMEPAWRDVTVEQLLSHRAGAPAGLERDGLWTTLFTDKERTLPALRRLVVETVTKHAPEFAPGSAFLYSNGGVTIAGAVAEQVTGRAYEDLMRERLFAPLEMSRAGFGPPVGDAPRGHRPAGGGLKVLVPVEPDAFPADNPATIAPAGTAHAPLEDWARFALVHLRGARGDEGLLLAPATFRSLHRPRGPEAYALGWGVGKFPDGGRLLTHSGSNTMWFATVVLAPDADVAVLVVSNCGGKPAEKGCGAAVKALLELARE